MKYISVKDVANILHECSTYMSYDGATLYATGIRIQEMTDKLNEKITNVLRVDYSAMRDNHAGGGMMGDTGVKYYVYNIKSERYLETVYKSTATFSPDMNHAMIFNTYDQACGCMEYMIDRGEEGDFAIIRVITTIERVR